MDEEMKEKTLEMLRGWAREMEERRKVEDAHAEELHVADNIYQRMIWQASRNLPSRVLCKGERGPGQKTALHEELPLWIAALVEELARARLLEVELKAELAVYPE
jgi:hypothetical protein